MIKLVDYCGKTYPTDERCKRLVKRFKPDKIVEILPTKEEFRNVLLSGKQLKFYI
jgi:hypothetical protein